MKLLPAAALLASGVGASQAISVAAFAGVHALRGAPVPARPTPSPRGISQDVKEPLWPQTSLEEVRRAQELADAANSDAISSTNGVGTLAYLHAGLRWERGFESRTPIGYRPSGTRVFAEAGGGLFAALPGGGDGGLGHPPGFHLAGGLIFRRTSAHPLTLTARYVQALGQRDPATIIDSRLSWFVVQVGWRLDGR